MVFLQGWVMLYPNFENWTALSTNHLEVGVHVRSGTDEKVLLKKRTQFELPLMELPASTPGQCAASLAFEKPVQEALGHRNPIGLLDLPFESLPGWDSLPVLDLWGHLSSEEEIAARGVRRYRQLMQDCDEPRLSSNSKTNGGAHDHRPSPLCRDKHDSSPAVLEAEHQMVKVHHDHLHVEA
jgi:hypothetical protein